MGGVIRAEGVDGKLGLVRKAEWQVARNLLVFDRCVATDNEIAVTFLDRDAPDFQVLINGRVLIDAVMLTTKQVR